ncbi:MAG: PepSY-associated TM helix domain-containing protein [Bacteroidales bacterium]
MKKLFVKLHLWLSLPFGIVFALISFTGALLVYEDELMNVFKHDRFYVDEVGQEPLPLPELYGKAVASVPDSIKISSVRVSGNEKETYRFSIERQKWASLYVDPYTGEVRDKVMPGELNFFNNTMRLHRWLMFPMKRGEFSWGKFIVGLTTIVSAVILILGIVIFFPKRLKWKYIKKKFQTTVRKGAYRFWHSFHIAWGAYSVIFLLVLCLTGLTWSFTWYRNAFYAAFGVPVQQQQQHHAPPPQNNQPQNASPRAGQQQNANRPEGNQKAERENKTDPKQQYVLWQTVLDNLNARNVEYKTVSFSNNSARVAPPNAGYRVSDTYEFDAKTGEITDVKYHVDNVDRRSLIRKWITQLHFGTWAGQLSKLLTFIACLIGAALPITGYYTYFKRTFFAKNTSNMP